MASMPTISELVARIKSEVLADIASGKVPPTVSSYSELHDYVDANMYAYDEDKFPVDTLDFELISCLLNSAHNTVDAWLRNGRRDPGSNGHAV